MSDREVTLHLLARDALIASDGNTTKAIDTVVLRLRDEPGLLKNLIGRMVVEIAKTYVGQQLGDNRRTIIGTRGFGSATSQEDRDAVYMLAQGVSDALLDFPLRGGVKLRDAKRDQVIKQAEMFERVGTDTTHKAKWLRLIAQCVTGDQVVGKVIQDDRAKELWIEASK